MPRIVVVGSLNMDLVMRSPRFPLAGETIIGGPFGSFGGGKGANQAVAAARLGADVVFVGCVGRDAWGHELRSLLERERIATRHVVARGGETTGMAVITVDPTGQNTIVVALGANMALTVRDIDAAAEEIAEADAVVVQCEVPLEANRRAIEIARRASVPVIFNAAPAQRIESDLLESVDILIVNEFESCIVAGLDDPQLSFEQIASHLAGLSRGHVIITLGERGCLHHDGQALTRCEAFAVEAVDATGAGDAFVAAFTCAWCEGLDGREALRFASAAGAMATTRPGAIASLPTRAAVEALMSRGAQSEPA